MERKKKRSHAEVVAAREAYAKERHEKLAAREARKAEREKLAAERVERRAARQARENMSPEELKKARYEEQRKLVDKRRKMCKPDGPVFKTYKGKVEAGDTVAARFAGATIFGVVEEIVSEEDQEFEFRKGANSVTLYNVKGFDGYRYPVRREKIVAKKDS